MALEKNTTVRLDENELATFLSISKKKKTSANARIRDFIIKSNEEDVATGDFKRKTYRQWAAANPRIMGKKSSK